MIRIERSSCPAVLKNAAADSNSYRHHKVVSALWKMQSEKCCYCERYIPEKGHAKAVEHFAPKSAFEARRNHWPNLLLACAQCNGKKSDEFPVMLTNNPDEIKLIYVKKTNRKEIGEKSPALIDPTSETNPEAHLTYRVDLPDAECLVGQMYPRNGSPQGKATITVIGLDQVFFLRLRKIHFRTLVTMYFALEEASEQGNQNRIQAILERFDNLISRAGEFAGLSREFARKYGLDVRYGLVIPDIT